MNAIYESCMRQTPIPTPLVVRLVSSFLFGVAVAVLTTSLARGVQVTIMVACLAVGIMIIFAHPYRREIRTFLEARNLVYMPKVGQIVPLFLVWLALMLAPVLAPAVVWVTVVVFLVIFGWMWLVFPHIDGTRSLAFID